MHPNEGKFPRSPTDQLPMAFSDRTKVRLRGLRTLADVWWLLSSRKFAHELGEITLFAPSHGKSQIKRKNLIVRFFYIAGTLTASSRVEGCLDGRCPAYPAKPVAEGLPARGGSFYERNV